MFEQLPMTLAVGPGVFLPILGAILASGIGLFKNQQAGQRIRDMAAPGGLPGTRGAGENLYDETPAWMRLLSPESGGHLTDFINTTGRTDPRTDAYSLQNELDYEGVQKQLPFAQEATDRARSSPLFGLSEKLGAYGEDWKNRGRARQDEFVDRRNFWTNRANQLSEEVQGRARTIMDDPSAITQEEMNAIVADTIGSTTDDMASRASAARGQATGRGMSPAAIAALEEDIAQAGRQEHLRNIADVARINADLTTQREGLGRDLYGTAGNILGIGGGIEGTMGGLINALHNAEAPTMAALAESQGRLWDTAEDDLRTALMIQAAFEGWTPNVAALGDVAAERGTANTLAEAGVDQDAANMLLSLGSGLFGFGQSQLAAKQAAQAAKDAQGGGLGGLLGPAFMSADLGLGALTGNAGASLFGIDPLTSAILAGYTGSSLGGLFD